MRLHRFYIEQKIVDAKEVALSDSELIHQMADVFRFKIGNQVIVFDGSGFEYVTEIVSLSKKEIVLKVLLQSTKVNQNKNVSLYLALIKKGNFELAAEKCTEVGVSEIHPIVSERSEKKDLNIDRLHKIVKEASEQSGRVTLPEVLDVTDLETAVSQALAEGKVCVTFHTDLKLDSRLHGNDKEAGDKKLKDIKDSELYSQVVRSKTGLDCHVSTLAMTGEKVAVFIGPEGGWTEKEMELFKKNNFKVDSLGQNILRAETAAIVAVFKNIKLF